MNNAEIENHEARRTPPWTALLSHCTVSPDAPRTCVVCVCDGGWEDKQGVAHAACSNI